MVINSFHDKYRFLSNFYPCQVNHEGQVYPSTEHAFQAAKTEDRNARLLIAQASHPAEAKRLGKRVALRPNWLNLRVGIMSELLALKFQAPQLAQQLLATGDEELIEGNGWGDTYWGVCRGEGQNILGRLLMALRSALRGVPAAQDTFIAAYQPENRPATVRSTPVTVLSWSHLRAQS